MKWLVVAETAVTVDAAQQREFMMIIINGNSWNYLWAADDDDGDGNDE